MLNAAINNNIISDQEVFEFIFNITRVDRYHASDGIAKVADMIKHKLDNLERSMIIEWVIKICG